MTKQLRVFVVGLKKNTNLRTASRRKNRQLGRILVSSMSDSMRSSRLKVTVFRLGVGLDHCYLVGSHAMQPGLLLA